jgi:hypothetical protein
MVCGVTGIGWMDTVFIWCMEGGRGIGREAPGSMVDDLGYESSVGGGGCKVVPDEAVE